jgi:hypothetical protein
MPRTFAAGLALTLAAVAGCGGPNIVPVSGVVRLNNKPYKNAVVTFQPLGSKDSPNPGRGSAGVTDDQGRFTLIYDGEQPGALVGKHRVRIFTDFKALGKNATQRGEPIPMEWHEKSEKTFEVPPGGTDQANFDIVTKRPPKG